MHAARKVVDHFVGDHFREDQQPLVAAGVCEGNDGNHRRQLRRGGPDALVREQLALSGGAQPVCADRPLHMLEVALAEVEDVRINTFNEPVTVSLKGKVYRIDPPTAK